MDAVEKAAEALEKDEAIATLVARAWPPDAPGPLRLRIACVVLDAVGYPAHQSSDEGTCWCPVAEQAGRERDAARDEADRLAALVEHLEAEGPHRPCVHGRCGEET